MEHNQDDNKPLIFREAVFHHDFVYKVAIPYNLGQDVETPEDCLSFSRDKKVIICIFLDPILGRKYPGIVSTGLVRGGVGAFKVLHFMLILTIIH